MCFFPNPNKNTESEAYKKGVTEFKCGGCPECLRERASTWALRAVYESKAHAFNCMGTLTYDNYARDENGKIIGELPPDRDLKCSKRDVQLFVKRCRKHFDRIGVKFKYIICAEHGKKTNRAHYHFIFFGVKFDDTVQYKKSKRGNYIYTSATLSRLWGKGICTVDSVLVNSAVARYCTKYCAKDTRAADDTFMLFSQSIGLADLVTDFNGKSYFVDGREYPIPRKVWEFELTARYCSSRNFSTRYVNRTPQTLEDGSYELSKKMRARYRRIRDEDPQYREYLDYWSHLADVRKSVELPVLVRINQLDDSKYHFYKFKAIKCLSYRDRGVPVTAPRSNCCAEFKKFLIYDVFKYRDRFVRDDRVDYIINHFYDSDFDFEKLLARPSCLFRASDTTYPVISKNLIDLSSPFPDSHDKFFEIYIKKRKDILTNPLLYVRIHSEVNL